MLIVAHAFWNRTRQASSWWRVVECPMRALEVGVAVRHDGSGAGALVMAGRFVALDACYRERDQL